MPHGWMNWRHTPWSWTGGNLVPIVIGILIVLGIIALLKTIFAKNKTDTLLDILNARYAAGEITKEEFCHILEQIDDDAEPHGTALEMLKKRYVLGQITPNEFTEMKAQILS